MKIRRARREDCQFIGSVHTAAVGGISTGLYTPEELQAWAVPRKPESYEELIRTREFFVAEMDDVIVGFGVLNQRSTEVEAIESGGGATWYWTGGAAKVGRESEQFGARNATAERFLERGPVLREGRLCGSRAIKVSITHWYRDSVCPNGEAVVPSDRRQLINSSAAFTSTSFE